MTKRERAVRARYQKVIVKHRRAPTATTWFELGTILGEAPGLGEGIDALACWRKCVKLAPRRAEAWYRLGVACIAANAPDDARRALAKATKLDPKLAAAWKDLAMLALSQTDDVASARRAERYLKRAIELDPRGKKLGWEPYAWLAEVAERKRDDPGALAWYAEANRRGDKWAAARKQVIEGHGARRRASKARR
jgi:tetratricopeptide (TPR) repeat protein